MNDIWQSSHGNKRVGVLQPSLHTVHDRKKVNFIKQEVCRLWKIRPTLKHNPVPNPVSLERKDLSLLAEPGGYVVAEKTDGVRYLMLLTCYPKAIGGQPVALMINRKYDIYEIRVIAQENYFQGSLFDGELVWEYTNGPYNPPRQMYLIFDLIACRNTTYVQEPFIKRFSIINDVFDIPEKIDVAYNPGQWLEIAQKYARLKKIVCEGNQYCLMFRPKPFHHANQLDVLWRTRCQLRHKSDGLIFTPIQTPVLIGTHTTLFKWKMHNTVEVTWKAIWNEVDKEWDMHVCYLDEDRECRGDEHGILYQDQFYPITLIPNEYTLQIIQWHEQRQETAFSHLIECACCLLDDAMIGLTLEKIRYDKNTPNQKITIERTLRNVAENITITDLLALLQINEFAK